MKVTQHLTPHQRAPNPEEKVEVHTAALQVAVGVYAAR